MTTPALVLFSILIFSHLPRSFCINTSISQTPAGTCADKNLSYSGTKNYLNRLRQKELLSHQKCQLLTATRNPSSLSVMEQLIWASRSPGWGGCVCVCVSDVFLSPLSDGSCLVLIGMTAFLGHVLCFDTFRFLQ